ncbi:MAG: ferredoxin [Nocardioides sp.]|uniref:ferredoxin n=1 Tax=Nocardioides sp. TaxID=35761 RepID=UPI003265F1B1
MTTPRSAPRPDVRLDDGAMERVTCTTCAARVEVRKSSWEQTSIQWHADAVGACLERRASQPGSGPNATFPGCTALDLSIREAAVRGSLSVQSGDALPVNPEGHPH